MLCRVMEVSKSAYYAWTKIPKLTHKAIENEKLNSKTVQLFKENKFVFGSRRLSYELKKAGYDVGRYQTRTLMKKLALQVRYPKKFKVTTDSNHKESISTNILDRNFDAKAPNQVWTTDITYVWTLEGWVYVAIVMDLFSRQIVGWAIEDHMRTSLCSQALNMAFWRRKPPPGLIHHSDRGSQYASDAYQKQLKIFKMTQSMSRKGNCWDNSPTERFFRSLKHEQLNYEKFRSKNAAKLSVIDYLAFYNGKRSHSKLGYKSPLTFEQAFYRNMA